ncbi:MAG: amidohydrolase/deacetylase family metallohydrolase [Abditibacteriales bacterium]|nr:amidohydrolase/deacetylase family metallohydrolase [Abditibacteriales bacterium]MDW8364644.1 amidohydrolase/deacetylase family metallohydrolase [Abditibacteriales bacterium]
MTYDLVLQGGRVIDPSQSLDGVRDVAVADGKIVAVAESITGAARQTIDVRGKLVTPGLIDIHTHVYAGVTTWGVKPDPAALRSGVTTLVDAGSPSWVTVQGFRWYIAEPANVRVLTFIHISGIGLVYGPVGEMRDLDYADPEKVAEAVRENADLAVGVKVRQGQFQVGNNGVEPLRLAVEAAVQANTRVMCHIGRGVPLPDVLALLRAGDIVTHCFQGRGDCIVDETGRVVPAAWEAKQRGVIMDVGHGAGSFRWEVAERALEQGFLPDVISTDLHTGNILGPVYDMPTTMSKFLHLGLSLGQVVAASTVIPARVIGRDDLGTLRLGSPADVAVFDVVEGDFEMFDTHRRCRRVRRKLQPIYTIAQGKVFRCAEVAPEPAEAIRKRFYLGKAVKELDRELTLKQ